MTEYRVSANGYIVRTPDGISLEICPPKESKFRPSSWEGSWQDAVNRGYRKTTELEIFLLRPEVEY